MERVVKLDEEMKSGHSCVLERSTRTNAVEADYAELRSGPSVGQGLYLVVSGPAPANGEDVRLLPALGGNRPAYLRIEIVSEVRNAANDDLPVETERYEKSIPLLGLSGTQGIELVAANGSKKFDLVGI